MLPRLKPRTFYDIVIQVAIVRPGPIQGDMVHPYLRRREGIEPVDYPTPELRRVLEKTLGVPLFQEQAMQVAIVCAGFTPSEADALRRSMATFKFTGGVHHFRDKMIAGMVERGYTREFAERTFSQIEGFGSYGFPESHAASFALIAYASSWLKCHHPDVFCCALLNAQPMGFYAPAQIVRDARLHGVEVRPVCVNASEWDCTLEADGWEVPWLCGWGCAWPRAWHARMPTKSSAQRRGARIPVGGRPVAARARAGSGAGTPGRGGWVRRAGPRPAPGACGRSAACRMRGCRCSIQKGPEEVDEKEKEHPLPLRERAGGRGGYNLCPRPGVPLPPAASLKGRGSPLPLPLLSTNPPSLSPPWPPGVRWWKTTAATGLTLRRHPVSFLRADLAARRIVRCAELARARDGQRLTVAGIVLVRQRPGSARGVLFITIEDETGHANLIVWPSVFDRQRRLVLTASMLACRGKVQREGEVIHVVADHLTDLSSLLRSVGQRGEDFPLQLTNADHFKNPAGPDPRETKAIKVATRDFR